jgi:hypothetical protein
VTPEERLTELVEIRRQELDAHATRFEAAASELERREELVRDSRTSVERLLRFGTADLEGRESDLAELARELEAREARIRAEEEELARRRGELGAVELKRAAIEQREAALAAREARVVEIEEVREADALAAETALVAPRELVAFVPGDRYRLVPLTSPPLAPGDRVEIDDEAFTVARFGPSPLPGDGRRCVYLVRGRRAPASDGSS